MKRQLILFSILSLGPAMAIHAQINYPETKRSDVKDDYFGTLVADPYRWLEDENSAETKAWVSEQNKLTNGYLSKITYREKIKSRLSALWDYEKNSVPFAKGPYYFSYKNNGKQNQSVLYIQQGVEGTPSVLLDPNTFSADGTTSLSLFSVSNDSKYAVYGISKAGSDWNEFYVIDLPSGKLRTDKLLDIKFSGAAWYGDGFFYTKYDKPEAGRDLSAKNGNGKLYFHKLGEPQSADKLIFDDPKNPTHRFGASVTDDEKYLVITVTESTSGNRLYCRELGNEKAELIKIVDNFDSDFSVIDHFNGQLIVLTNHKAPRYRLLAINPLKPAEKDWTTLIPETEDVLQSVDLMNGKLVLSYLSDVKSVLKIADIQGNITGDIRLPGPGMVSAFSSQWKSADAFFSFTGFTDPGSIYKYDDKTGQYTSYRKSNCVFVSDAYETRQVFYKSTDGTKIPMYITMKKGTVLNGNNPTYLYGYGGFNISVTPSFSPNVALFLEQGGIYAVANIRGGGEYGSAWHKAGTVLKKQNVFNDFIAAAEYLIAEKYTSSEKLTISGRSNGGLLVGACMTQRPDLFKVALPGVGVLDMLRYHKFTIGYAWAVDYGTSENKEQFKALYKYSPVHNAKAAKYPATLVFTADHDDRVVPAHSYKFISALQAAQQGANPVLIRIDINAGHGAGKPLSKTIDEWTDIWAFVFENLGMTM